MLREGALWGTLGIAALGIARGRCIVDAVCNIYFLLVNTHTKQSSSILCGFLCMPAPLSLCLVVADVIAAKFTIQSAFPLTVVLPERRLIQLCLCVSLCIFGDRHATTMLKCALTAAAAAVAVA